MATLGALAATLKKFEGEAIIDADYKKEQLKALHENKDMSVTHHYKTTVTHTVETDTRDDYSDNALHTEDKSKKHRCGCFAFLRARKK